MRWSAREVTAYHEAGHAVIGRVLDLACGEVTIVPDFDAGSAGCAITDAPWVTASRWMDKGRIYGEAAALRARIITYMAGAEAEIEWCGNNYGGDDDDRLQIDLMLDSLLPLEADLASYRARLRIIARGLVRRHRARIGLVAAALLDRGTLTDAEVRHVAAMRDELPASSLMRAICSPSSLC